MYRTVATTGMVANDLVQDPDGHWRPNCVNPQGMLKDCNTLNTQVRARACALHAI